MKKLLCLILTLLMVVSMVPVFGANVEFTDLNGHWARNYVLPLAQDGIISGKAPGVFPKQLKFAA